MSSWCFVPLFVEGRRDAPSTWRLGREGADPLTKQKGKLSDRFSLNSTQLNSTSGLDGSFNCSLVVIVVDPGGGASRTVLFGCHYVANRTVFPKALRDTQQTS